MRSSRAVNILPPYRILVMLVLSLVSWSGEGMGQEVVADQVSMALLI